MHFRVYQGFKSPIPSYLRCTSYGQLQKNCLIKEEKPGVIYYSVRISERLSNKYFL